MTLIQSVTVIYITGLICLLQGIVHFLVLKAAKDITQKVWIVYMVLLGIGLIGLASSYSDVGQSFPVISFFIILVAQLARFISLSTSCGRIIQRKPLFLLLGGIFGIIFLYEWSSYLDAPLGSLETIVLLPIATSSSITAWYAGLLFQEYRSFAMLWMSRLIWVEACVFVALTLGALIGVGSTYVDFESNLILNLSIGCLIFISVFHILWLIHCTERFKGIFRSIELNGATNHAESNFFKEKDQNYLPIRNHSIRLGRSKKTTDMALDSGKVRDSVSESTSLTHKELEVLKLVVSGQKNKEISETLGISEASVKVHKSRMTSKLGVKSLPELKLQLDKILSLSTQITESSSVALSGLTDPQASSSNA